MATVISETHKNVLKISKIGAFDYNPRGNLWANDESRFGHKLLSKMGWSQGKGLGKNESGITEVLKIRMNVEQKGVGWEEKFGIDTHDFDSVLEDLNKKFQKSNGDEVKSDDNSKSVEKRSHQFKNRLHYKKFIKMKDVSRYSDKDMDGIFISQNLKSKAKSIPEETSTNFKSELSMTDYFANKLKNKLGKLSEASISSKEEPKCIDTDKKLTESETTHKKRKTELKNTKKTKKIRLSEPEISDNTKINLSSEEVFNGNIVEECSSEISKLSEANINSKEEPKCIDTDEKLIESEATRKKRKKELKNLKKTKERLSEPEIIDNTKTSLSSEEVLDGDIGEECSSKISKLSKANISSKEESKCIDTDGKSIESEATRKKRKKELKNLKKTKERLSEPEIDNTKTNLLSEEVFNGNIVEECSSEISKLSKANIGSKEEPKCIDTDEKLIESEATCKKRKKEFKNSKKTKEIRLLEPEIIDNTKTSLSSEEVLDGDIGEECSSKIRKLSEANISSKEEPKCMETDRKSIESEATFKKRKKELKNTKKTKEIRLSEPEIIDNTKSNLSSVEVLDGGIVEECSSKISNNKSLIESELSDEKSENFFKSKIQVLKSCLKNRSKNSGKLWLNNQTKNVSFNDSISYKIIEDDFAELDIKPSEDESTEIFEELLNFNSSGSDSETTEDEEELLNLSSDSESTEDEDELLDFSSDSEITEDEDETRKTISCGLINSNSTSKELVDDELLKDSSQCGLLENSLRNNVEEDVEERPGCVDLPKCDGSHYDNWLETQRNAIKMKIYQKSLKKFRKHPVLRGTNLLDIKGYGNWGF
ncbi:hypothetical protein TNIN_279891 [Trichonephila inaurata madagascariensis]|uniref:G-patch domain-containing protein n=1 Tax=Trichonephila inaurata madagascariensis TaxID=2747483 RepID=A0A8X6XA72_9ARAC|nr:hypothetical protein TNIN_279891 [Trichonephila inaurata madagascariensis]